MNPANLFFLPTNHFRLEPVYYTIETDQNETKRNTTERNGTGRPNAHLSFHTPLLVSHDDVLMLFCSVVFPCWISMSLPRPSPLSLTHSLALFLILFLPVCLVISRSLARSSFVHFVSPIGSIRLLPNISNIRARSVQGLL